jgi:hypothetical protein
VSVGLKPQVPAQSASQQSATENQAEMYRVPQIAASVVLLPDQAFHYFPYPKDNTHRGQLSSCLPPALAE